MKNLIIIGARGFGREIYSIATQCKEYQKEWTIKGFLDDKLDALEKFVNYPKVLSSVEEYEIKQNDVFICALGNVKYKKKYTNLIMVKGGKFINIIHPTSIISKNTKLGTGIIVCPFTYVSNEVTIGDFVTIQSHCAIGHDVKIGDYCQVNALSFFGGFSKLEDEVTINPGSMILPKKVIGENSVVGINSSVIGNIKPNRSVYGNPAIEII